MLKVNFSKASTKFLKTLPKKQGQQCALKIQELRKMPMSQDVKKLKGYPYYRCAAGEFRIVFEIQNETLEVLLVDKRNDDHVYKKLKRRT
jgi:mRNA interferase RelE/StbE